MGKAYKIKSQTADTRSVPVICSVPLITQWGRHWHTPGVGIKVQRPGLVNRAVSWPSRATITPSSHPPDFVCAHISLNTLEQLSWAFLEPTFYPAVLWRCLPNHTRQGAYEVSSHAWTGRLSRAALLTELLGFT